MNIKNIFKKWFGNVTECILCLIAAVVAVGVTFIVYERAYPSRDDRVAERYAPVFQTSGIGL